MSEQRSWLAGLVNTYFQTSGMSGPLTANEIAAIDTMTVEVYGRYVMTHAKAKLFIEGLCMWVLTAIHELESDDIQSVLVSVAKLFVEIASGIMAIVAEHDLLNDRGTEIPPVIPNQLVHIDMRTFISYVNRHRECLKCTFSAVKNNRIVDNLAHIKRVYCEETVFKAVVDSRSFLQFTLLWNLSMFYKGAE